MVLVAPSILSADFARLDSEVSKVEKAGADWLHFDVMDGVFVPNITIGAPVLKSIKPKTNLFLDVHLMIINPHLHVHDFIKAGADMVTFHIEAYSHDTYKRLEQAVGDRHVADAVIASEAKQPPGCDVADAVIASEAKQSPGSDPNPKYAEADALDEAAILNCIDLIKKSGARAGISINPGTSTKCLEKFIDKVDMVLFMSVNPGFGGQSFMPVSIEKIKELKAMTNRKIGLDFSAGDLAVEIDGGIAPGEISAAVSEAGANVLVAGSAVYKAADVEAAISGLKGQQKV